MVGSNCTFPEFDPMRKEIDKKNSQEKCLHTPHPVGSNPHFSYFDPISFSPVGSNPCFLHFDPISRKIKIPRDGSGDSRDLMS